MMSQSTPNQTGAGSSDPDGNGSLEDPQELSSVSGLPTQISNEEVSDYDDHDMFTVPEIIDDAGQKKATDTVANTPEKCGGKHKTADRGHKKIKRLLRNRVSAQHGSEMEQRARELQESNCRLEEKISTLINENTMLRKVLISSRPKNENADSKP